MHTDDMHFGATPEDWKALQRAGLTMYLLPYVADPNVPAKPDDPDETAGVTTNSDAKRVKRSWRPGAKMPGVVDRNGFGRGIRQWNQQDQIPPEQKEADIRRWAADPRLGICIHCKLLRAIDVDVDDLDESLEVEAIIAEHLGPQCIRRRAGSNRFTVAVKVEGSLPKIIVKTKSGGAVEFLGDKQQFFAVGLHKSGKPYQWDGGSIPEAFGQVSFDQYQACLEAVSGMVGVELVRERSYSAGDIDEIMPINLDDPVAQHLNTHWEVHGVSAEGKLFIRCPWEDLHTSDNGDPSQTIYMPQGLGGHRDGAFKCLHAHCAGRTRSEWEHAIGYTAEGFDVVPVPPDEIDREPPAFLRNEETGAIRSTPGNVMLALRKPGWLGVDLALDEFRDEVLVTPVGERAWRAFRDSDYMRIRLLLEERGLKVGSDLVKECINLRADEHRIDAAITWLEHEVPAWDGVHRIDRFYPSYYGSEDSAYTRAVSRYVWTALAGRVLDPGCKVDMAPILSSGEGCRKSESIAAMVPDRDFFVELDLSAKDDDMSRLMRGRLVAELGEMRGLRQREMGALKAFMSRRFEHWVPKYREFAVKFPRRLLFIGTTNETAFLSEQTGQRRWLPMTIVRADVDRIEADRLQLWAEAREAFRREGVAFAEAERLARDEYEQYQEEHVYADAVREWLLSPVGFGDCTDPGAGEPVQALEAFKTADVLSGALRIPLANHTKKFRDEVCKVLRQLGFEYVHARAIGGRWEKVWRITPKGIRALGIGVFAKNSESADFADLL